MASLLNYSNKGTLKKLNRKVALRQFRTMMGDLERQANQEDRLEKKVDLKSFMNNPHEVYSKRNVDELNKNLRNVGNLQREYIDDIGLNQTNKDAPPDDIESIKKANAKALEWDNQLNPDPSLIAQQSTAKSLAERSENRKRELRNINRMKRRN